jgi:hypothetical protein
MGFAAEIVIPDSALIPSTEYFANDLGSALLSLSKQALTRIDFAE